MNWIILIVAGFFESGFAFCLGKMKEVSGTEWYLWGAGFLVSLALSMTLLAKAVQTLPIGTAYPVWTGIGAVGTVVLGIVFFHEPASFLRLLFITDADSFHYRIKDCLTLKQAGAMDWIILIVAGLFETAFAFCLGKMNEAKGKCRRFWATGLRCAWLSVCGCLLSVYRRYPLGLPIRCGRASGQ